MQWLQLASAASGFLAGVGLALGLRPMLGRAANRPREQAVDRRLDIANRLEDLKHVVESAGIGTFFWDLTSDALRWSDHHYTIFGWPVGTPVTHAMFRQRVHPADLASVDAAIGDALRTSSDYAIRFRLRFEDGSVRYVRGSGRVNNDSEGRPSVVNGAVVDITETTQALNATRQRELDLASVAVYLPDIICRFDCDFRCLFMSPRIEALTGRPAAFYSGKKIDEFGMSPVLAARWSAVLEDVLRHRHVREFDFIRRDQHGDERFFITRMLPSLNSEGDIESVLTVSSDHTERERDARKVREDGISLKLADLRKNEYLATLAHELRGPLAPIASAAQLIKFSKDRAVRNKAREVIERQVTQLAQLVNDLMEVGRISSGKLEINKRRITVREVIDQAAEAARPLLDQKEQALVCELPELPIWLDGDALRLTQVFTNLLTNASKYSPPGSPVSVEVRVDGSDAVIRICDSGIGLSQSAIAEIFDLFVQVHPTGVNAQGGLGIGLTLVKQLTELHGGTVNVMSEGHNQGSCFIVSLPCLPGAAHALTRAPVVESLAVAPLKVLVVDDNVDGATTLALLLEALGHTALVAFNGLDAVEMATTAPVDLAFLDLGLPDISGVQVALRIRGTPKGRKLPLVALTGLGRPEDRYLTAAAQFNEHVTKPLSMHDLVRITRDAAERRERLGSLPKSA